MLTKRAASEMACGGMKEGGRERERGGESREESKNTALACQKLPPCQ